MVNNGGKKIVLTASNAEMAGWGANPFIAFAGGFPARFLSPRMVKRIVKPHPPNPDYSAPFAPYGLRKIEAALLENGFDDNDIITVQVNQLENVIGSNTRVIGVSSMDPLGMAYVSLTYSSLTGMGGIPATAMEFWRMMRHPVLNKYNITKILGGSGSWQLKNPKLQQRYGFDCIVMGEAEHTAPSLFRKAIRGEKLPPNVQAERPTDNDIPIIRSGAIYGAVEISRGCGRGCQFCSPTMKVRRNFSIEKVLQEVRVNLRAGSDMILLNSDDVFLYGSKEHFLPNRKAVVKLFKAVVAEPGVRVIQPAHISLAPAIVDPQMVEELSEILNSKCRFKYRGKPVITAETGVETGSPRLMHEHMRGKALPYNVSQWSDIVCEAFGILNDHNWLPLCTLVIGLPKETEDDVLLTLELVHRLRRFRTFFVPLFFVSLEDCALRKAKTLDPSHLTDLQWEVFNECWDHNLFHWQEDWQDPYLQNPITRNLTKIIGGFLYLSYYKWRHGSRSKRLTLRMAKIQDKDYRFLLPFHHPFGSDIPEELKWHQRSAPTILPVVPGIEGIPTKFHYANNTPTYRLRAQSQSR